MPTKRRYAWMPTIVSTWRNTRALVWMQHYFVKGADRFTALGGDAVIGESYCNRLGAFSVEF